MTSNWLVWQLADSAFPAGALAHSSGLEAAVQHRIVVDGKSLREFAEMLIRQLRCGAGVFVDRAWQARNSFTEIDADCDLFLNSTIANRASRTQGQAFLATAAATFRESSLKIHATAIRQQRSPGHLAPTFGLICRILEIDRCETAKLFTFTSVRGCLSSAVRLGVIGPLEAQRIQATLWQDNSSPSPGTPGEGGGEGDFVAVKSSEERKDPQPNPLPDYRERGPATQISPLLDLVQSTQDRLYSRLFQS